jgi:hypothetical protein
LPEQQKRSLPGTALAPASAQLVVAEFVYAPLIEIGDVQV